MSLRCRILGHKWEVTSKKKLQTEERYNVRLCARCGVFKLEPDP